MLSTNPHANSRYGYFSLSFVAADRWNMLPIAIRQAASLSDFHALVSACLGLSVRSHRLLVDPLQIIKYCCCCYINTRLSKKEHSHHIRVFLDFSDTSS